MAKKKTTRRTRTPHDMSFAAIETNYRNIEDNRSKVFAACQTNAQRQSFFDSYNAARDTYWIAVASQLEENHQFVKDIREDLVAANKAVTADLEQLQNVTQTLKLMAETTKLAASLATIAAT